MWRKCVWLTGGVSLLGMLVARVVAAGPEPIVYYPLDQLGATVADASGNGRHGAPHGALALGDDGYLARCFQFNGSDAYVELARPVQDDFTLAAWIKTATPGHTAGAAAFHGSGLFWSDVSGSANDFVVGILGTKVSFNVGNPNTSVTSKVDVVTGEWVHVAGVRDINAGAISVYVNGTLEGRVGHTNKGSLTASPLLAIGANVRDVRYYAGLVDEVKIYDVALSENEIGAALKSASVASSPSPEDGATDVPRDVVLSWRPGRLAAAHDVYFGTVFESVNDASRTNPGGVLVQQGQTTNVYDPAGVLAYGETYYWRIDDVNAPPDSTVFKGKTWRFTTEPYSYPLEGGHIKATASSSDDPQRGPEKTVDESGLNDRDEHSTVDTAMWLSAPGGPQPAWIQYEFDKPYRLHQMWVWNSNQALEPAIGLGAKSVTVEYSTDGLAWTKLGEFELARGPGKAGYFANTIVDLAGVAAPQVRLVVNSTWGSLLDQCGLSEVRFFYVPVLPQEPQPSSGQSDVPPDVVLGWRAGREAVSHEVYLGTEAGSLPLAGAANGTSYDTTPLDLQLGATYYWKVHEVNAAETPSSWDGETWSFSTPEYLVVDDFESYTDDVDAGEAIFQTWIDGWEVKGNGSQVGYAQSPFAERTIVHGGKQSMPLLYDNTGGTAYSEIELALDQDWTRHGIATLVLFFHGSLGNTGQLYVKIDGMKIAYPGDAGAVGRPRWTQWNIDLASVGASSLRNTRKLSIGIEGAGSGTICIDDIRLYRTAPAPAAEEIWIQAEAAGTLTAPMKVFDDPMAMGGKCIGTDDAIGNSSSSPPTPNGTATYTFTVKGGVYKISGRVIIPNDESFWVRIPGATTQTHNHSSGWVRWSDPPQGRDWHWAEVFSAEDANAVVQFTMAAGTYQLEIGYREDGALLDAIVIESMD